MVKPDVFFVYYKEPNTEQNWLRLLEFAPDAIPVGDIEGIHAAHRACAERASTTHFIVVDADNWVLSGHPFEERAYDPGAVYVWRARNAVNGLVYGNGAIKALPREATLAVPNTVDMTSGISRDYRIVDVLASEHRFDASAYDAWRTAFRECVKLASSIIPNQKSDETRARLDAWCSEILAQGEHAEFCVRGARMGRQYGERHRDDPDALRRINDYEWLIDRFAESL